MLIISLEIKCKDNDDFLKKFDDFKKQRLNKVTVNLKPLLFFEIF